MSRVPAKIELQSEKTANIFGNASAGHPSPVFQDARHRIKIFHGDCLEILALAPESCVDLVFADPPYFLSNNGVTCRAGRMVSVNKGEWDRSRGPGANHEFNRLWLAACQRVLKPNGTIWVSGTSHVIHSVGFAMQQLGMKLLNDITWVKPNPPPNLSCRYFTHSTETIIWAAKSSRSRHTFHYKLMRELAGGKQMKSVWTLAAPGKGEKRFGKHPAQKPLALLERILLAASNEGDVVLDPFMGSGTTVVAALRSQRCAIGVEMEAPFIGTCVSRLFAETVFVGLSVLAYGFGLDLGAPSVDRSDRADSAPSMALPSKIVHREKKYFFVGSGRGEVIYTASAENLEDAWREFRASHAANEAVLIVVKAETEIYLAQ